MQKYVEFPKLGLEFSFKNSIQLGPITISFYGILIAVGLLLAMIYALKTFRKVGVDPDKSIDAILGGIIGGIVGARLYYVAFTWEDYGLDFSSGEAFWESFSHIFKTWEGGMAIYGGLIGALIIGLLVAKWRKIKIKPLLDVVGIGFLLGQGIGRWGNFINVEAFGNNTDLPWGMASPSIKAYLFSQMDYFESLGIVVNPEQPVHPTFLYESLWCLLGFVLLAMYLKHRKFDGEVFLMYLGFYGVERLIVEGLRTDSLMIGALRVSQVLAAVLVFFSAISILVVRSKIKSKNDPEYLKLYCETEEGLKIVNNIKEDEVKNIDEEIAETNVLDSQDKENDEEIAETNQVDTEDKKDNTEDEVENDG